MSAEKSPQGLPECSNRAPIDGAAEIAVMCTAIGMALRCARAAAPEAFNAELRGFRIWASTTLARGNALTPGQRAAVEGVLHMVEQELKAEWPAKVRAVEDKQ